MKRRMRRPFQMAVMGRRGIIIIIITIMMVGHPVLDQQHLEQLEDCWQDPSWVQCLVIQATGEEVDTILEAILGVVVTEVELILAEISS